MNHKPCIMRYESRTMNYRTCILTIMLLLLGIPLSAQKGSAGCDISLTVTDARTKEPVIMCSVVLNPLGQYAVTDAEGRAEIRNIPAGTYTLTATYIGYETFTTSVKVGDKPLNMKVEMKETSLMLNEVSVTAKQNAAGTSTASIIGRQAIDHLQASSLADVMQLVPGQLMTNSDLTQQKNLQLREISPNNVTSAFGNSVVIDGVPISNNGSVSQGPLTEFTGTDLRNIAADDINEVEVVRGIPSAEYGDLTSGMVIVHSKAGVTPWQLKAKINPAQMNYSVGKGGSLGKGGILNGSLDYAQAWGDPRMKTNSYHRYTGSLGWSYDINRKWNINTKVRFMLAKDWTGDDPDATIEGTDTKNTNQSISITHNGRIQTEKLLARTLTYTVGLSFNRVDRRKEGYTSFSGNLNPILTAMETGYVEVPYESRNYRAISYTESRPGNIYAKISDRFYVKAGKTRQTFKVGAEYHYDWNNGRGYYNEDDRYPLEPNSNGRPRAYSDIPGLHQVAAYAEDQLLWTINKVNRLRATLGLRFTAMQPFADVATTSLSPRLNLSFSLTRWMDLRAGIGLNSKTPGLNYLYPDKKYTDRQGAPNSDNNTVLYHTHVYDVKYSKDMTNATTTKVEAGIDIRLPKGNKLSILGYIDNTPDGFGNSTEYVTYTANYYPKAYYADKSVSPERSDIIFITTGAIGNTSHSLNRGVEIDMDFGTWKLLRTSFYLSGAWQESKTWSTNLNSESLNSKYMPQSYVNARTTPFKVVYPNGLNDSYSKYRRLVTTLRTVTHIPELRMVASLTAQVIWHNWNNTYNMDKDPIGWIDTNCKYHDISADMLAGYLGMDGNYYATAPTGMESVGIYNLMNRYINIENESSPITWNIQARLTKELGRIGGLSFYVNNALYYEPFLQGNSASKTRTQYNTGLSFGAELYFNL